MVKTPDQVSLQNLSQISGPACPQLFDLASFLRTIAFDKAEPILEEEILSNCSVQEKLFATYITGNL